MSISAQNAEISLALQVAKIGKTGTYTVGDYDYEYFLSQNIQMGVQDDIQQIPLRVGGPLGATGAFKQGVMYAGQFDFLPSPASSLGWMLLGLMGLCTTTADSPVAGAHTHKFSLNGNGQTLPWATFRSKIPKNGGYYSETGFDCRFAGMSLMIPNQGLVEAQVNLLGRDFVLGNGSGWTYVNSSVDPAALLPKGHQSVVKAAGTEMQVLNVSIDWMNNFAGPQQETVVGYPKMLDITKLNHACQIRVVELWDSDAFRRNILTKNPTGTDWNGDVYETITATPGTDDAFSVEYTSPSYITGTTPYKLRFRADQVNWRLGRPMPLRGGSLIAQEIIGVPQEPTNPAMEYGYFELVNGKTGYVVA